MGFHGPLFTWCNKRETGSISKKLDRVLINRDWVLKHPQSYCVFEAGGCSDHLRCKVVFDVAPTMTRKPFKFVNVLSKLPGFIPAVAESWQRADGLFHSTSALFRFSKQLKNLKPVLRALSREALGDLPKRAREAHEDLCLKQHTNYMSPSSENQRIETAAYLRWERLSELEEAFLQQKSKIHWLNNGDQNTKTFHQAVKTRELRNSIREIKRQDGTMITDKGAIQEEAVCFFKDFLSHHPQGYVGVSKDELEALLNYKCTQAERARMIREVNDEEVRDVLFSMPSNKSPGPDGYTSEFFKESWQVTGRDFIVAIQSFFRYGFLPKGVNSTILALIPKKEGVIEMKDYRPISCCNVMYKVISKILANRLKEVLPNFIAPNQSAFVKNRLLIENLLLASELVKDYHKDSVSSRSAFKIDISKAFDSVQWDFLFTTLEALSMPVEFIHWIRLCVTTASFSVQVNGELAGYFQSTRGLRQGCSLSPYLFVISMNVLSKLLDKAAKEHKFGYHPMCKSLELTHLCFADDIMVFTNGRIRSMEGIITVFDDFERMSGLKISLEKSTAYLAGITQARRVRIASHFPFSIGSLPVRYLGLPLLTKRMSPADYAPLIDKIKQRLSSWTARLLSYAGRLQLIKSVIMGLVNFWMAAFRLPSLCITEIEKLCSSFLWSGPALNPRKTKVIWKELSTPKHEGGLGLRDLKTANRVTVFKLLWRLFTAGSSLWVNWVQHNLIRESSFWSLSETQAGSWMWKKLLKCRDKAAAYLKKDVRNGLTTSFWYDDWSPLGRLILLTGARGFLDLGIPANATIRQAITIHRRRRHRVEILNKIEDALDYIRQMQSPLADRALWKVKDSVFKHKFQTSSTYNLIRDQAPLVTWHSGVWFSYHTPKFAFLTWLAAHNRLCTNDRVLRWNANISPVCILCQHPLETRNHLFFECSYVATVWTDIGGGLFGSDFTTDWDTVMLRISSSTTDMVQQFLRRYAFQTVIYHVWRERNDRRHGGIPKSSGVIIQLIDKAIRNRLSSILVHGDGRYEEGMQQWFASRPVHRH